MSFDKPRNLNKVINQKGLVICNFGDGKGKTTAAIGTAVRAIGAGLNVFILQFVKAKKPKPGEDLQPGEWPVSSEIELLSKAIFPPGSGAIVCEQVGAGFVGILGDRKEKQIHQDEAQKGRELAKQAILSNSYDLVILDEILSAVDLGLLTIQEVVDLVKLKPSNLHLFLTGHEHHQEIIDLSDTITDMRMVKHAYYEGVQAQAGIDY